MVCDNCRCYADYDTPYPHREQTCGIRKRGYIIPCEPECCAGGCPNRDNDIPTQTTICIWIPVSNTHRQYF
jgi:hypothetical protein